MLRLPAQAVEHRSLSVHSLRMLRRAMPAKKTSSRRRRDFTPGMEIIHEDRDILVVSKQSGLLTVADEQGTKSAYEVLTNYVKKGQPKSKNRVFIVHRIDRETSGLLIFAKTEEAKTTLQQGWDDVEKTYLAITRGRPEKDEGLIRSYLHENSAFKVFSSQDPKSGKLAESRYRVVKPIGASDALVEVVISTGRKHQIRVHMAELGCPIVGDVKYGTRIKGNKSIALHAAKLKIAHPYKGTEMTFEAEVPHTFYGLAGLGG